MILPGSVTLGPGARPWNTGLRRRHVRCDRRDRASSKTIQGPRWLEGPTAPGEEKWSILRLQSLDGVFGCGTLVKSQAAGGFHQLIVIRRTRVVRGSPRFCGPGGFWKHHDQVTAFFNSGFRIDGTISKRWFTVYGSPSKDIFGFVPSTLKPPETTVIVIL